MIKVFYELNHAFEPIWLLSLKSIQFFIQLLLCKDEFVLFGSILVLSKRAVQVKVEELVHLFFARETLVTHLLSERALGLDFCLLLFFKLGNTLLCPSRAQRNFFDLFSDLGSDGILAHIRLRTADFSFGTPQIIVTLLRFGGDEAPTLATAKKSAIEIGFECLTFWLCLSRHHFLTLVKKFLCDNRFVLSFVYLAIETHEASVDWILEHLLVIRHRKGSTTSGVQSKRVKGVSKLPQGEGSRGIGLKGFSH